MIDRRRFIEIGTAAAGVLSGGALGSALAADTGSAPGATVQTAAGKIRGVLQDKVHTFKGVPYAASTAGAGRFMPPAKPKPWKGVRDTVNYGARSPQLLSLFHGWVPPEVEVMDRDEPMSEECLFLNVWTAGLERAAKRPVMVWLHGGGYTSGSGAFYCYDGSQLAAKHDVVALTVNHRLSVLGYLYLAGLGSEKYAQSSNVGMLDIVAALEWVRDNIAAFGGDPGNVTIFGQSGGGGKVSTLMAMPAAKGLFHRAIVQSGAAIKGTSRDAATRTAKAYLARLNVQPNELDKLASFSADQLLAVTEASKGPPLDFGPVTDGQTLPTDPFDPAAPALSADVPLLIGTVETEVTFFPNQILDPIDDATLHARVKQIVRGASDAQTDKLIAAYRAGRPKVANTDLYLIIASDATFRAGVVLEAERKAAQARAPVYQYYWTWHSPVREGKLRAFHTIEIPFVFDNVDAAQSMVGKGADRYALATRISDAFTSFARTGTPDHENLPHWPAFDLTRRAVMIFDNDTRVENDPHGDEQRLLHAIQSGAA